MSRVILGILIFCVAYAPGVRATLLPADTTFRELAGVDLADSSLSLGTTLAEFTDTFLWDQSRDRDGSRINSGSVDFDVVRAADNTLDFYWRVQNDSTSSGGLGDIRFLGFFTTVYDAFVINDSGDLDPQALRFDRRQDAINFNFTRNNSAGLEPGQTSSYFFIDTEAVSFNETDLGWDITNLGQSNNSDFVRTGFAPDPVPEEPSVDVASPPTPLLFTLGLVALGLARRKC